MSRNSINPETGHPYACDCASCDAWLASIPEDTCGDCTLVRVDGTTETVTRDTADYIIDTLRHRGSCVCDACWDAAEAYETFRPVDWTVV